MDKDDLNIDRTIVNLKKNIRKETLKKTDNVVNKEDIFWSKKNKNNKVVDSGEEE